MQGPRSAPGPKGESGAAIAAAHTGNTNNPHGVTKEQVGLGNVDNTADKDKTVKYAARANVADGSNYANQLQAFASDDFTDGEHFIKAIRESYWWMRLYGCYKNGKKEANCVRVAYADDASTANKAASADGVKDYAGERTIQIGWSGARVQAEECESLAVYKDSTHIKDMNRDEARK